jgi:dephospho-CoA kinase
LPRPIAVAITGGIGAGKSAALAAFRRHGAATVSSDEIVHHLLAADDDVRAALVEHFGEGILGADGRPDRRRIGKVVFSDRDELAWLESLLHPLVAQEYLRWRDRLAELPEPPRVTVTEVPLLYESGGDARFDHVVVVTAPEELRRGRRSIPLDDRDARLIPDDEKVRRADFAYVNDGSVDELDAWVADVLRRL